MAIDYTKEYDSAYKTNSNHDGESLTQAAWDDVVSIASRRLKSCNTSELTRLQCEKLPGQLVIRGRVSSYYLKQLAQELIRSLEGNCQIVNQLDVVNIGLSNCVMERIQEEIQ